MMKSENEELYYKKSDSQKTKNRRSRYIKGDCCYGCPYDICPIRPDKPFEMERPNCTWKIFLKL